MRAFLVSLCLLLSGCAQAHMSDVALRLEFERGLCSGTAVGRDLVLTAAHCFADNRLLRINDREAYALKIVRSGRDHALVRVTIQFQQWATVGVNPRAGEAIRWIGNPAGLRSVYRFGYVVHVGSREILIQAPVFGGDSGSGIFNERGQLVGVVTGYRIWIDARNGMQFVMTMAIPMQLAPDDWRAVS